MLPCEAKLLERIEASLRRIEALRLERYVRYARDWRRRLLDEFVSGMIRGIGFSIGFSILGALVLYVLRRMTLSNLPGIGKFFAELVRIIENNL